MVGIVVVLAAAGLGVAFALGAFEEEAALVAGSRVVNADGGLSTSSSSGGDGFHS